MKIVQSFWSKPYRGSLESAAESRFCGGWLAQKYFFTSWALSCMQLTRFYDDVELVTDQFGKELLIDKLGLPYSSVKVVLGRLDDYPSDLWALGKLYTYSIQDDPFLHVDGDLFIWDKFESRICEASLVAQHLELGYSYYDGLMKKVDCISKYTPMAIRKYRVGEDAVNAYNLGLFGGRDLEFIRMYAQEAFKFIDLNLALLRDGSAGPYNTVFEQVLFYYLASKHNKKVNLFTYTTGEHRVDEELKGFQNLCKAPEGVPLIHLYGNCKKDLAYCEEISRKLRQYYPEYYHKIAEITDFQYAP